MYLDFPDMLSRAAWNELQTSSIDAFFNESSSSFCSALCNSKCTWILMPTPSGANHQTAVIKVVYDIHNIQKQNNTMYQNLQ